jgi:hypothetical protein
LTYAQSAEFEVVVAAPAQQLFDYLDDQENLGTHMQKSSVMMLGSSMAYEFDETRGRAVGSVIRMTGKIAGLNLQVEEVVIQRQPPFEKVWETRGEPHLLVIGSYRMGFETKAIGRLCRMRVFIDFNYPNSMLGRVAGWFLGRTYARWCVRQMAIGAQTRFSKDPV